MKSALIITTYNWPQALRHVLDSVIKQSRLPDQVIIADDGSREETAALIREFKSKCPVPVLHSWQEDDGFRAAESRNKALAAANPDIDYFIIIDGDMILPPHFVADHLRFAKRGTYVQGSRVLISPKLTLRLLKHDIPLPFKFHRGFKNRLNSLRLPLLSKLFTSKPNSVSGTRSCNMGFWRDDILAINGFNNEYVGWGREDSDLAVRLRNAGRSRRKMKFLGCGYHLHHNENDRGVLPENDQRLRRATELGEIVCANGIGQVEVTLRD